MVCSIASKCLRPCATASLPLRPGVDCGDCSAATLSARSTAHRAITTTLLLRRWLDRRGPRVANAVVAQADGPQVLVDCSLLPLGDSVAEDNAPSSDCIGALQLQLLGAALRSHGSATDAAGGTVVGDYRLARGGDCCAVCSGTLRERRGIEVCAPASPPP